MRRALASGANAHARKKNREEHNWTVLMEAAKYNRDVGVINALLDAGADVNARDDNGWSALLAAAAQNSNPGVVEALVEAGANRTATTKDGHDAFWYARHRASLRRNAIRDPDALQDIIDEIVRILELGP